MSFTFKQRFKRKYVSSRIICFYEYEKKTGTLRIGFNDGIIANFENIPNDLINQFESASSKGKFFNHNFRNAGYKYSLEPI